MSYGGDIDSFVQTFDRHDDAPAQVEPPKRFFPVAFHFRMKRYVVDSCRRQCSANRVQLCRVFTIHDPSLPASVLLSQHFDSQGDLGCRMFDDPCPPDQ